MELEAYRLMYELEERHWWYRGLHELVFDSIDRLAAHGDPLTVLDAGCGTGSLLRGLGRYGFACGVDCSPVALTYCRGRGLTRLAQASVASLPFRDAVFDIIVSTDVLYHTGVTDDLGALREFHRVLKPGGLVILHVPAFEFLRRAHDRQVHSRHRYRRRELASKLLESRLRVAKITYRNAALLPAMLLIKTRQDPDGDAAQNDLKAVSRPLNTMLLGYLKMENRLLRHLDLPFGTSVFCVAQKNPPARHGNGAG
jgi:SAM-dependent methyltransferase